MPQKTISIDWADLHAILVTQGYPLPSLFHCSATSAENQRGAFDRLTIAFEEQHATQRPQVAPLHGRIASYKTRRDNNVPSTPVDLD